MITERARPLDAIDMDCDSALGLVLAEDVASDVDSPPHDKSTVDGYAVRCADAQSGAAELHVIEEVVAGAVPLRPVAQGEATRIMTGAPVPVGADAVVMFERTATLDETGDGDRVRINDARLSLGQNIMRRASSMRRGERVLEAGRRLRSVELGLLAEIGRTRVRAIPAPTVAVLSTGNELVASDQIPDAGQIRNSNSPLLVGCVRELGATAIDLGIATDDAIELRTKVSAGLKADVLVVCGGVSAGLLDLVPQAFTDSGVVEILHKVAVKPGKPLWFGVLQDAGRERLVFGLPGNPVSSFVCFQLFVRPALMILAGRTDAGLRLVTATLAIEQKQRGERETYLPARAEFRADAATVTPLDWRGSGDLAGLSRANALARFPAGERTFLVGATIEVLLLD